MFPLPVFKNDDIQYHRDGILFLEDYIMMLAIPRKIKSEQGSAFMGVEYKTYW